MPGTGYHRIEAGADELEGREVVVVLVESIGTCASAGACRERGGVTSRAHARARAVNHGPVMRVLDSIGVDVYLVSATRWLAAWVSCVELSHSRSRAGARSSIRILTTP